MGLRTKEHFCSRKGVTNPQVVMQVLGYPCFFLWFWSLFVIHKILGAEIDDGGTEIFPRSTTVLQDRDLAAITFGEKNKPAPARVNSSFRTSRTF